MIFLVVGTFQPSINPHYFSIPGLENSTEFLTVSEDTHKFVAELKEPGKYKLSVTTFSSSGSCQVRGSQSAKTLSFYISKYLIKLFFFSLSNIALMYSVTTVAFLASADGSQGSGLLEFPVPEKEIQCKNVNILQPALMGLRCVILAALRSESKWWDGVIVSVQKWNEFPFWISHSEDLTPRINLVVIESLGNI